MAAPKKLIGLCLVALVLCMVLIAEASLDHDGNIGGGAMWKGRPCGAKNQPACKPRPKNPYNRGCNPANGCRTDDKPGEKPEEKPEEEEDEEHKD